MECGPELGRHWERGQRRAAPLLPVRKGGHGPKGPHPGEVLRWEAAGDPES